MTNLPTFALIGRESPVDDAADPTWEVVAYPSRMSCFGPNWESAQQSMLGMIHQAMEYEGSGTEWYLRQFRKMSREQKAMYVQTIAECASDANGVSLDECSPELRDRIHHFAFYAKREGVGATALT